MVMKVRPSHIGGRYWPVLRMKMPVAADTRDKEMTNGMR